MGGEHSGISEKTTSVFLESAYFNPITVAGKARRFGLHTDASARFERGVDWRLAERASNVLQLLYSKFVVERRGQSLSPTMTMPFQNTDG